MNILGKIKGAFIKTEEEYKREQTKQPKTDDKYTRWKKDAAAAAKDASKPKVKNVEDIKELLKQTEEKAFLDTYKTQALKEASRKGRKRAIEKSQGITPFTKAIKLLSKGVKQVGKGMGEVASNTNKELSNYSGVVDLGGGVNPNVVDLGGGHSRLPDGFGGGKRRKHRRTDMDDMLGMGNGKGKRIRIEGF